MLTVLKYSFFDLLRSRWTYLYFLFFLVAATTLLYLSSGTSVAVISMMNLEIILIPLVSIMFGTIYYYQNADFNKLLLSLPIKRSKVFLGQYLGIVASLGFSFVLGISIPFIVYGIFYTSYWDDFLYLLIVGVILTTIFLSLSFLIGVNNTNKMKGFGLSILTWFMLAVIYDGIVLFVLFLMEQYPLEKITLILTILNPIDLGRTFIMLQSDQAALLGFTGAVFRNFFGTKTGISVISFVSLLWVGIPLYYNIKKFKMKDF